MRQDQFEKLVLLSEKLTDAALIEADPENWNGADLLPMEMTRETRGDRYWCKKNAVATLSLIARLAHITQSIRDQSHKSPGEEGGAMAVTDTESELDAEVAAAEKEANKLLKKLATQEGKAQFVKSASGKA